MKKVVMVLILGALFGLEAQAKANCPHRKTGSLLDKPNSSQVVKTKSSKAKKRRNKR